MCLNFSELFVIWGDFLDKEKEKKDEITCSPDQVNDNRICLALFITILNTFNVYLFQYTYHTQICGFKIAQIEWWNFNSISWNLIRYFSTIFTQLYLTELCFVCKYDVLKSNFNSLSVVLSLWKLRHNFQFKVSLQ